MRCLFIKWILDWIISEKEDDAMLSTSDLKQNKTKNKKPKTKKKNKNKNKTKQNKKQNKKT